METKNTKKLIQLDNEITRGMLKAERSIKPRHTDPWSPQIHHQNQKYCEVKQTKNEKSQTGTRKKPKVNTSITQEITKLKKLRTRGEHLRDQYLEELADIQELKGNKTERQ